MDHRTTIRNQEELAEKETQYTKILLESRANSISKISKLFADAKKLVKSKRNVSEGGKKPRKFLNKLKGKYQTPVSSQKECLTLSKLK